MMISAGSRPVLMVAECHSDHPAGRWAYVTTMRCSPGEGATTGDVRLADLGTSAPVGDVVVWNWRQQTAERLSNDGGWTSTLTAEEWTFHVVAPVLACGIAVVGEVSKFVTAGDARLVVSEREGGVRLLVKGAGERVTITGWAERPPTRADGDVRHDAATGIWGTDVLVPPRGWTTIDLTAG
jgi:hypothetical protein